MQCLIIRLNLLADVAAAAIMRRYASYEGKTVYSAVGDKTALPCTVNTSSVTWRRKLKNTSIRDSTVYETIFDDGFVMDARFSVDVSTNGARNLVIQSTAISDDGTYECIEDGGFGFIHTVHLEVSGEC